jgi:hypothetical protein
MPGANPGLAARLRAQPLYRWECLAMSDLIRILNHPLEVLRCLPLRSRSPLGDTFEFLQMRESCRHAAGLSSKAGHRGDRCHLPFVASTIGKVVSRCIIEMGMSIKVLLWNREEKPMK